MKRISRCARIIIRGMRLIAALISMFLLGGQNYPPPYPREGTKALIDNARAQVWDVSWPMASRPGCIAIFTT